MAERNRQENRAEPSSDRRLKPLVDEYLASTREPVGSHNLFRETPDRSEQVEPRTRAGGRDEVAPGEPAAIMLYLVCVALLLIAVLAVGLL